MLPSASFVENIFFDLFANLLALSIFPALKASLAFFKHCNASSLLASILAPIIEFKTG